MIFPVILLMTLAAFQIATYVSASRRVQLVSNSAAQMISQTAPPPSSSTALVTATDVKFAQDAAMVLFPYLLKDASSKGVSWNQDISINIASVQFTQINTTCNNQADLSQCYIANVVWTTLGSGHRVCSTPLAAAANNAVPSSSTLPASTFGPGSMVVVDVVFTFVPTFGARFVAPITVRRSTYLQPRYATLINFDTSTGTSSAARCPGY